MSTTEHLIYKDESKVLQYLCNVRHNLAVSETSIDVKMMNHTEL